MKINLASIFVDDQKKALEFYTEILGFETKQDIPMGECRFLTVISPEGPDGIELLLEPNTHPAARTYQKTIFEQGIPATSFAAEDVHLEYERLKTQGVEFRTPPTSIETTTIAVFDDTCGNLIQIHQP
jgi:predicted enzyme related to lactoylglutathione lyase